MSGGTDRLLAGRVAVVTGGAAGLGAAIASRFAASGARGAVVDLVKPPPEQVPADWLSMACDVRDAASVQWVFDETAANLGSPAVVVANAGIVPPWTTAAQIDVPEWDAVFAVNARGVMLTIREAVRRMSAGGGSIIAMASLNGWKGDPHLAAYVASKHAVVGLVRSVALDVGHLGIRVNALAPGPIATDALLRRMAGRAESAGVPVAQALRQAADAAALRRMATVAEVADAALFLASDLSSAITGHLLPVDAGLA